MLFSGGLSLELEELILKLSLMEKQCIQEKLEDEKEAIKDEFTAYAQYGWLNISLSNACVFQTEAGNV